MAERVTNYQCPNCTGGLHFSESSGRLECEYCGSSFSVEEIEAGKRTAWDPAQKETWEGMNAYNCPSCGAQLLCEETTAATSCPYCGNPTVVPEQLHGIWKPDFVIPFRKSKDEAIAAIKNHYHGKFFLPRLFAQENHLEEIKGLYVPFWLFDSGADADCCYHATKVHTHREGDYEVTTTRHYALRRAGSMDFERIPVDGSSKMPDDYMDSIEPFDYGELKPFSAAYLPGFLADRYDVTAKDSEPRAEARIRQTAQELMREDIMGYTTVTQTDAHTVLHPGRVGYALLPVWLLSTRWQEKTYLFAMNGQTGKLVGDLPVDKLKYWLTFAGVALGVGALSLFTGLARWIVSLF